LIVWTLIERARNEPLQSDAAAAALLASYWPAMDVDHELELRRLHDAMAPVAATRAERILLGLEDAATLRRWLIERPRPLAPWLLRQLAAAWPREAAILLLELSTGGGPYQSVAQDLRSAIDPLDWAELARRAAQQGRLATAAHLATAAALLSSELAESSEYRGFLHDLYFLACGAGMAPYDDEPSLHLVQDYARYRERHPQGPHAGHAEYVALVGRGMYTLLYGEDARPAIRSADEQITGWRQWLVRFVDHPGADDASWRLGDLLERRGRYREAAHAFAAGMSLGDGDMHASNQSRLLRLLDIRLPVSELEQLRSDAHTSQALQRLATDCLPIQLLREGRFAEAALLAADRTGAVVDITWMKRWAFAGELAGLADRGDTPANCYAIARACYHNDGMFHGPATELLFRTNTLWSLEPLERLHHLQHATGKGHALMRFEALAARTDCPQDLREKALYSAATAAAHLAQYEPAWLERARPHYQQVVAGGGALAAAAERALAALAVER
jgi:hypothetical protein